MSRAGAVSSPFWHGRGTTGIDKPKAQRAGDRGRFDKLDGDRITEPMRGRAADESAAGLVKTEVLLADSARRNKTIGAGFVELDEQTGPGYPRNMAVENRADAVGQEMGDQAIGGLALGFHGAAFGRRNVGGDFGKAAGIGAVRQAISAKLERTDQGAMDDQIGIAADRRGEMRVAPQIEPEMAEILRRIFSLRLRAQHDFIDQPFDVAAFDTRQNAIEPIRTKRAALG